MAVATPVKRTRVPKFAKRPTRPGKSSGERKVRQRPPVTAIGAEIDGNVIRVAEIRSGQVVSYRSYVGETVSDAIDAWGPKRSKRRLAVSFSTDIQAARTDIGNVPDAVRPLAIAAAAEAMFPAEAGTLVTAGIAVGDTPEVERVPATVVAIRRSSIEETSKRLRKTKAVLLPAPLTVTADGLYLSAGSTHTSLTLVSGGMTTAYRELPVTSPGWDTPGLSETDVSNYLTVALPDVSATTSSWESRGHRVPSTVFVVGPGSRSALLPRGLASIGLRVDAPPTPEGVTSYDIPASEISTAWLAICAAVAPNQASIRLVDAAAEVEEAEASRVRRRRRTIIGAVGSAAVLVTAGVVPLVLAGQSLSSARHAETVAEAQAASVSKWNTLAERVKSITADEKKLSGLDPHYASRLAVVLGTAPSGTSYTSLSTQVSGTGLDVTLSASVPGSTFSPIASWVKNLEAKGATQVDAQSFSAVHGSSSIQMTLTLLARSSTSTKGS